MTLNAIESLLRAVPFEPFTIHMQCGNTWTVDRPEQVRIVGHEMAVYLSGANGKLLAVLSVSHMTQFTLPACYVVPQPPFRRGAT